MSKYDTVVFDMDGTVLNTLEDLTDSVNYVMEKYGYPIHSLEAIRGFVGNGIRLLMERALPDGANNPQFEAAFEDFSKHYAVHCKDKTGPYDGIIELMKELKRLGYKTAIVSNKADFAVRELADDMFNGLVGVAMGERESEGINKKPAPDMVYAALEKLGSDREHSVYVGDSDVDIMTAANSGLDCVCVEWGFKDHDFLVEHGAKTIITKPSELLKILQSA